MRNWIFCLAVIFSCLSVQGQMVIDGQTLYGNEWINYNKTYIKLTVAEDGMYKVNYEDLQQQGLPNGVLGARIQIHHMGKQVATLLSSEGVWNNGDYIIFHGEMNRGEMDSHHFVAPVSDQLNPRHSLYSDESSYFLSWGYDESTALRYDELDSSLSGNLPVKKSSFIHVEEQILSDNVWAPPSPFEASVFNSSFTPTEGFGSRLNSKHNFTIPVSNLAESGPAASLRYRFGSNNSDHNILIYLNDNLLETEIFQGYNIIDKEHQINLVDLKNNNTLAFDAFRGSDLYFPSIISLTYPKLPTANNSGSLKMTLPAAAVNNYYEIEDFNSTAQNFVFDVTNNQLVRPQIDGSTAKFLIERTGPDPSDLYLVNNNLFKTPLGMSEMAFTNIDDINPEYLILSSKVLDVEENGVNSLREYVDFRASEAGGGYRTHLIFSEDICEQFGYGIAGHSYAIRNFSNYVKSKWPDFEMVFIIGKALDYTNRNKQTLIKSLVPTYGRPGSDNLLFAEQDLTYPYVGVGRLAAANPTHVRDYLNKVKVHAGLSDVANLSVADRLWMKNVIHLSGGGSSTEQAWLFNYLSVMKGIIEDGRYAAKVKTYQKTSSDPVQTTLSQQILGDIDEGASFLTFFGHSSAGTFDFSIEDPAKYDNYGRWPVMLAMGCFAGDIHSNIESLSEKMILTKDLGAIAFIASSGPAFPNALADMGNGYYERFSESFYGKPIGLATRDLLQDQYKPENVNFQYRTLHEQNIIHGDPAVTLFAAPGPDYVIDLSTVVTSDDIGSQDDFIDITFDVVNLGQGVDGTISNYMIHSYGNDQQDTTYFTMDAPYNREPVSLKIKNPGFDAIGKNSINIVLDYKNEIEESPAPVAEENNDLKVAYNNEGYCFYVFDNSAFPIYPTNYAIVYKQDITLKASASNAFADKQVYVMELDTTEMFDSSLKLTTEVESYPGLIEWTPNIQYQDEVVYYWRIIPKDVENTIWNTSSFVYLEDGTDGWNQSHLFQWLKDDYTNLEMKESNRQFDFVDNVAYFKVENLTCIGNDQPRATITAQNDPQAYLEFAWDYDGNITGGVYISVIDGVTGVPWKNSFGNALYGSVIESDYGIDRFFFPYWTRTPEERELAMTLLEDIVPDGHFIVFYTIQRTDIARNNDCSPEEWAGDASVVGRDLFSILEKNGATKVRDLENGAVPYIFAYRKGDPSWTPIEKIAPNASATIEIEFDVIGKWNEGNVSSTVIGPAVDWDKLLWNLDDIDTREDSTSLSIIGITPNGDEVLLFEDVRDFDFDLSSINATQYPYIRLNLYSADDKSRSSAQMEYWRVLFSVIPEAVLNTSEKFVFNSDTLMLGESLRLNTLATNVTETDMDSLLVKYTIVDNSNNETVQYDRLSPLKGGATVDIDFEYSTADLAGLHQFIVEINPDEDQREQYDFNNIGIIDFNVTGDNINPLLDVTFDGMHIMDGDIVSPTPRICVILRDESEQFFIDDISNFELALQALPNQQEDPIDLSGSDIIFTPGDSTTGFAKLEFLPDLSSGEYILSVQGTDASGNLSGDQGLKIRFNVIEESSVSNVLNYPNPFSTSTQFVFTLTGYDVPDVFTIQIMTVSGKVVKEITKEELGNIRVGVNRTDYKWNGTDEFGNKLANGVYLYRILSSHDDDEEIGQYNNQSIDGFFKKGFGKLVIMR